MIKAIIPYLSEPGISLGVLGNDSYSSNADYISAVASAIYNNKGSRFFKKLVIDEGVIQARKNFPVYALINHDLATIIPGELVSSVVFLRPDEYFTNSLESSIELLLSDYCLINGDVLSSDELDNIKVLARKGSRFWFSRLLRNKRLTNLLLNNGFPDYLVSNINEVIKIYDLLNFGKRISFNEVSELIADDLEESSIINELFNKLVSRVGCDYNFIEGVIDRINDDPSVINNYLEEYTA